jgi:hypothetical protein
MLYKIILPNGQEVQLESDEITFDISKVIAFYDVNKNLLGVFPKESGFYLVRESEWNEILNKAKIQIDWKSTMEDEFEILKEKLKTLEQQKPSLFKRIFQWKF